MSVSDKGERLFALLKKQSSRPGTPPVLLAPMAGVTDSAFRRLAIREGCEFTFTEMVSANGLHYNNRKTEELISISGDEMPCGVQLFGHEPDVLSREAARDYIVSNEYKPDEGTL